MARAETSRDIDRPISDVYAYVADPGRQPEWAALVLEVRGTRGGPAREGDTFTVAAKFLGRRLETTYRVTAADENRLLAYKSTEGPVPHAWTFTFEPEGDATRVTSEVEGEPGGFFALAAPLVENAMRRQMETDLATLQALLESRA